MDRSDPIDTMDKRHFSRVPFDANVEIHLHTSSDIKLTGQLQDISLKGLLFEMDDESAKQCTNLLLKDMEADIKITLNNAPIEMTAEVKATHTQDKTIGFVISQMPIETIQHLKRLVLLNIGNEEMLQRELHNLMQHHE